MGIPDWYCRIVKNLYDNMYMHVRFKGRIFGKFKVERGIKQGCPLSGLLFALGLDPWFRKIRHSLEVVRAHPCAYADDLGIVAF
eukprot:1517792-Pyramimonas_sp.AAC.1